MDKIDDLKEKNRRLLDLVDSLRERNKDLSEQYNDLMVDYLELMNEMTEEDE